MNRLNEPELQTHINVLGWLYILVNSIFLLFAALVFGLLPLILSLADDPQAVSVFSVLGIAFGLLLILLGLPGIFAGYGLLKHKPWARMLTLVLGFLGIVNFPLGTALGVYTLWVLFQQSANENLATNEDLRPRQPA
jgi:hypothetical protein